MRSTGATLTFSGMIDVGEFTSRQDNKIALVTIKYYWQLFCLTDTCKKKRKQKRETKIFGQEIVNPAMNFNDRRWIFTQDLQYLIQTIAK